MVSENWLTYKLEKWFTYQCNYYSYNRLKSAKLSQVCKTFSLTLSKESSDLTNNTPLLINQSSDDSHIKITKSKSFTSKDIEKSSSCNTNNSKTKEDHSNHRNERRWKSLRLSFNKKNEKHHEDRTKPVLPKTDIRMDFTYLNNENDDQPKEVNLINFERRQRQLLNELAMKRTQVEEFKKELEASNLRIHEITRSLDSAKGTLTEQEYNLNLALKNAKFFENQLQSKRDSVTKARLQQESAVAESKGLRELLHKAELQNYNLTQELNEMKAQHSCDVAYQKELMNQDNKIRAKIGQLTEAVKQCQSSLSENQQLSEKIKSCENAQKSASFYQEQFYKYKDNYVKLQEKYLFANAAVESFQRLATENQDIFHANQEVDVILEQWDATTNSFKKQIQAQNEIIENLTKSLQNEKDVNVTICKQEAELEKINQKLRKENELLKNELTSYSTREHRNIETQTNDVVTLDNIVKGEVIELIEDN